MSREGKEIGTKIILRRVGHFLENGEVRVVPAQKLKHGASPVEFFHHRYTDFKSARRGARRLQATLTGSEIVSMN